MRLPPSATRILRHWGVEKEIAQKASSTTSSSTLDVGDGGAFEDRRGVLDYNVVFFSEGVQEVAVVERDAWAGNL
jgi:hypothetical protein